jgi:hypothetical protein
MIGHSPSSDKFHNERENKITVLNPHLASISDSYISIILIGSKTEAT